MNIDKQEIKAMALACDPAKCADEAEESRRLAEFYSELTPELILALLAEIEGLTAQHGRDSAELRRLCQARDDAKRELNHLKGELESVLKNYRSLCASTASLNCSATAMGDEIDRLKAENEALRRIISESATACGAAVSVECSLEFMQHLPGEIALVIGALRKDAERYRWLRMPWQEQRQVKAWTSLEIMDENIDAALAREVSR
ncbi:hypothetical protein [Pseudomonas sp. Marseille-QA0332]